MMPTSTKTARRWLSWTSALWLMTSACAAAPPAGETAFPSGAARIWVYRDWQPSESMNLADVYANGSLLVSVGNGAAIYRDVPPGRYHLAPDSFVPNSMQDATIELAPGQQAYIKIVSLSAWGSENTAAKNIARDAFWVWVVSPTVARAEIARSPRG
jgi:hypothetical protein